MKKLLLLIAASLLSGHAVAATYSTVCNNCDIHQMHDAATRTTNKGTVYVFDADDGESRKLRVVTEIVLLRPYLAYTWAEELTIEPVIKSSFKQFVSSLHDIDPYEPIVLPPDFPIRSVAGYMIDPGAGLVRVTDAVRRIDASEQVETNLRALLNSMLKHAVPFLNLGDFLQDTKLIIEFPDGSTMEFELYFSVNATSGVANLELRSLENARMSDGSPAPTTGAGFRDFNAWDSGGSLSEWILWARSNGIPVVTTSSGDIPTEMYCQIHGTEITCVVIAVP